MYEFLVQSRDRFLARFREVGWDAVTKDRGATWNSMLGIFAHLLDVEESWLHSPKKPNPDPSPGLEEHVTWGEGGSWEIDPLSFKTLEALEEYHQRVAAKTRALLGGLASGSLEEEFVLEWTEGRRKATLGHIMFHSFVDQVAHLGELDCLLWQIDVDPDWLSWLDLHQRSVT